MRQKRPDKKNAISIIESAKQTMDYTLTLEINEMSSTTITRNIYECFRMLGDAMLISKGTAPQDHILPLKEISSLQIRTEKPISLVENLRILRHNVNYYGYNPTMDEVEYSIIIARSCFYQAYEKIKTKNIGNMNLLT